MNGRVKKINHERETERNSRGQKSETQKTTLECFGQRAEEA